MAVQMAEPMARPIQARTVRTVASAYDTRWGIRPTANASRARHEPRKTVQKAATDSLDA